MYECVCVCVWCCLCVCVFMCVCVCDVWIPSCEYLHPAESVVAPIITCNYGHWKLWKIICHLSAYLCHNSDFPKNQSSSFLWWLLPSMSLFMFCNGTVQWLWCTFLKRNQWLQRNVFSFKWCIMQLANLDHFHFHGVGCVVHWWCLGRFLFSVVSFNSKTYTDRMLQWQLLTAVHMCMCVWEWEWERVWVRDCLSVSLAWAERVLGE